MRAEMSLYAAHDATCDMLPMTRWLDVSPPTYMKRAPVQKCVTPVDMVRSEHAASGLMTKMYSQTRTLGVLMSMG